MATRFFDGFFCMETYDKVFSNVSDNIVSDNIVVSATAQPSYNLINILPATTCGFQQAPTAVSPLSRQSNEKWHDYIGRRGMNFEGVKAAKLPVCKLGSNVLSL
jgi:hypothetical protein